MELEPRDSVLVSFLSLKMPVRDSASLAYRSIWLLSLQHTILIFLHLPSGSGRLTEGAHCGGQGASFCREGSPWYLRFWTKAALFAAFAEAIIERISEAAALNSPWRSSGSQETLDGFCSNSESRRNDGASW